jgi:hypothetical protein
MKIDEELWSQIIQHCEIDAEVEIFDITTIFRFKYPEEKIWFGQMIRANSTNFVGAVPVYGGFKFKNLEPLTISRLNVDWSSKPAIEKQNSTGSVVIRMTRMPKHQKFFVAKIQNAKDFTV